MQIVIGLIVAALAGFIAGLLVGRRNPKIADAAASAATIAKTETMKVADATKDAATKT